MARNINIYTRMGYSTTKDKKHNICQRRLSGESTAEWVRDSVCICLLIKNIWSSAPFSNTEAVYTHARCY